MPIYEYECNSCGVFEEIQKFEDDPLETCPQCQSKPVQRLVSKSAFHLKGGGWYKTDYAGGGAKPESKESKKTSQESNATTGASEKPKACGTGCGCAS